MPHAVIQLQPKASFQAAFRTLSGHQKEDCAELIKRLEADPYDNDGTNDLPGIGRLCLKANNDVFVLYQIDETTVSMRSGTMFRERTTITVTLLYLGCRTAASFDDYRLKP